MKKWSLLETAKTPDGKTLTLHTRDGRYDVRIDGVDLMSSRQHASEEKLAEWTCEGLGDASVLIGGLGLGFTLRAALATLGPAAHITVAELLPAIVEWNRNPNYPLARDAMADARVEVVLSDVDKILGEKPAAFDAILLDTDNGPEALTAASNDRLYREAGLKRAWLALKPGGRLGVWSVAADPRFLERMQRAGFEAQARKARSHSTSGGYHTLFIGRRR